MKILLVEDDELIAHSLETILKDCHYVVDIATEGQLGWDFVETYDYDLILLDVVLPKLNGIDFCKRLRDKGNQTPVLLLTAQNSSSKKVIGLDAGADDYVVKPFETSELLARIRVLLRRKNHLSSPVLQWEKLTINSSIHEVTYDEKVLNLTPKEYSLLELFVRNEDRVLTREIILDSLWSVEEAPNNNTVTAHIKDIRRKLKKVGANSNLIETVYGVGYRLKPLRNKAKTEKQIDSEKSIRNDTKKALNTVWQKFEQVQKDRLKILEQAERVWQQNSLEGILLEKAQWAAHKLGGSLGVFGFARGSLLAVEIEQLLKTQSASNWDNARHFSQLLKALKHSLKSHSQSLKESNSKHIPVILAVDNRWQLVEKVVTEITTMQIDFELIQNIQDLEKVIDNNISIIIWQFSLTDLSTKQVNKIAKFIKQKSPLPVIIFTDRSKQSDRLKLSRLGYSVILQKASLNQQKIRKILSTSQQLQNKVAKVLFVDDDSQFSIAIKTLLESTKINFKILNNPLNFLPTIAKLKPDLLILDVTMPNLNGIELCQLIRNDSRWQNLPILFLTIHKDSTTLQQILHVGANDYINKASANSELVPKIFNHLFHLAFNV